MLDIISRSHASPSRRKHWKWIALDSLIIAGIAFFAVLPSSLPDIEDLYICVRAFGAAFLLQAAVELGLRKPSGEEK